MPIQDPLSIPGGTPAPCPAPPPARNEPIDLPGPGPGSLLATFTLSLWLGCLLVGGLGLALRYPREYLPPLQAPTVVAETLRVELTKDVIPPDVPRIGGTPAPAPPPEAPPAAPPPPPDAAAPPEPPPLAEVAEPKAVAFAVPVEGPVHVVDAKAAPPGPPTPRATPAAPSHVTGPASVRHLTFGIGEGRQPAPDYPREAVLAGEQGTVVVRFTVGQDGRVTSAVVAKPSRWPLLNQAAVRAVREEWRFAPGPLRSFDVPVEFQLNER